MTTLTLRDVVLPARPCRLAALTRGYSVTELVIVISIIGVLAGITVGSFNQFLGGTKDAVATERQEMLNQALHRFAQYNHELLFSPLDSASSDEIVILRTLQYRNENPARVAIGSPYFDPRYNPVSSSSPGVHRLRWTGRMYELLKPGTTGTGLLMNFEGTDFTDPFVFPPNFKMAGR